MKLKITTEVSLNEPCVDFGFVTWLDVEVLQDEDDKRAGQGRVAIIHAGRLAALGTTAELKALFANRAIVEVHAANPVEAMRLLDEMPEIEKTSLFGTAVHAVLKGDRANAAMPALRQRLESSGMRVNSVGPVQPSLEDVFLEVVEKAG